MKRLTKQELETLQKIFAGARDNLLDTIINHKSVGLKTYQNEIYRSLQTEIKRLREETGTFALTAIPREYEDGLKAIYNYFTRNNLRMRRPDVFAKVNYDAVYNLAREMQLNIEQGLAQVGRQILRYTDKAMDNALRQAGLRASAEKIVGGRDILFMRNNMIKQMQEQGFMTVQYGAGKSAFQVPLDVYAMMCARSTTAEATNIARENQLKENGYDLVQMTEHYPTCEVCAQYQGRVYSISGKDKRFPALFKTAFQSGYRNVHPNCRHAIVPYIEELATEEEQEQAQSQSNRPFEDVRGQNEIDLYNEQQAKNRELRQDLYQYERYKARLGEDAPKTFPAFRKMKKAGGVDWENIQSDYRSVSRLSEAKSTGNYTVNVDVVSSDRYKDKFSDITGKPKVDNRISKETRRCISLNASTSTENYAILDASTGETISKGRLGSFGGNISIPKENKSLILTHNHPLSSSFSYDDIDTLVSAPNVKTIVAGGHDGTVYRLSVNSGKRLDNSIITEYNVLMEVFDKDTDKVVHALSGKYNWKYEVK